MRLIAEVIRISHAKSHCQRLTTLQDIQDYSPWRSTGRLHFLSSRKQHILGTEVAALTLRLTERTMQPMWHEHNRVELLETGSFSSFLRWFISLSESIKTCHFETKKHNFFSGEQLALKAPPAVGRGTPSPHHPSNLEPPILKCCICLWLALLFGHVAGLIKL